MPRDTAETTSRNTVACVLAEQVNRGVHEVDPDLCAVASIEGFVGLDRHRAAVDAAGDERVVAHELGGVDFPHDPAIARLRDLAVLRANTGDRSPFGNERFCPEAARRP